MTTIRIVPVTEDVYIEVSRKLGYSYHSGPANYVEVRVSLHSRTLGDLSNLQRGTAASERVKPPGFFSRSKDWGEKVAVAERKLVEYLTKRARELDAIINSISGREGE